MNSILKLENVSKSFGDFALQDVSFSLEPGLIMGFIGPNGAGKSTTIKLIMNLLKKDSGQISVFGKEHVQHQIEIKRRIGFVYDENHFYEELTIVQTRSYLAPLYPKWDNALFSKYVKEFELPLNRKIKDLSKGMKMKCGLLMAISHHAELLIMDEPTSGLDPLVRSEFLDILSGIIQDEGRSVFFSTHITSDLERIADYVTLIDRGQIIFSKTRDDLFDSFGLIKGENGTLPANKPEYLVGIRENRFGWQALTTDKRAAQDVINGRGLIERPTLDDILVHFTRRDK